MAEPQFHQYDPSLVVVVFRGITINGFAEGTFIKVERAEDLWTSKSGAQGDVVRVRNRNKMGSATIELLAESPANELLSAAYDLDEKDGTGSGDFMVKDLNSQKTLANAPVAWIKKIPALERATEGGKVTWVLDMAALKTFLAGSII